MYEIEYWRFILVQNLTKTLYAGFPLIVTHLYVNIGDQNRFCQNVCIAWYSSVF